jgi:hypothetical protein
MTTFSTRKSRSGGLPVSELRWGALNKALLECTDESKLRRWLDDTVRSGHLTRSVRIYGRLNYVRRQREMRDIKAALAVNNSERLVVRSVKDAKSEEAA